MKPPHFVGQLKQTYAEWSEDNGPRLGAALPYFGAEFTRVCATTHGSRIEPTENAEPTPEGQAA